MSKNFYITTTLPYVNAEPHIGFAMEIIRADVIARWKKSQGYEVFFNTGTDEHGAKIFEAAKKAGQEPQAYVDEAAKKFQALISLLNLTRPNFIRTTAPHHIKAVQEFWKICAKNGYIYKKPYKIKYCVGCELEKTDSELVDNKCPLHSTRAIEKIEEENYFFKFSEFQKPLLDLYEKYPDFIVPAERLGEIKSFVSRGLQDFSISRLKEKMPWGIEVPDDPTQVFYVWFDALVNYISAIGWPTSAGAASVGKPNLFEKFWVNGTPTQYCGKDNLRQQAAMWQTMLMAAGLPPSRQIVIDGFITGEGGVKMSKSLGNIVSPSAIVEEYSADALRYFVTRELHPFEDSPFTMERFKDAYNANLANGLGNLVSRVLKMAEQNQVKSEKRKAKSEKEYEKTTEKYDLKTAMDFVWEKIQATDKKIQETQPFKLIKTEPEKAKKIIDELLSELSEIAELLLPFMPETAEKILELIKTGKVPEQPLFPRK